MGFAFWSAGESADGLPEITPPVLPVVPARGECFALSSGYWRLASMVELNGRVRLSTMRFRYGYRTRVVFEVCRVRFRP